jgi:hypothetical protein
MREMKSKSKSPGRPLVYRTAKVSDMPEGANPEYMTTDEVAKWLTCSLIWLKILRGRGEGPDYQRLGPRTIRYRREDVTRWLKERVRTKLDEAEARTA